MFDRNNGCNVQNNYNLKVSVIDVKSFVKQVKNFFSKKEFINPVKIKVIVVSCATLALIGKISVENMDWVQQSEDMLGSEMLIGIPADGDISHGLSFNGNTNGKTISVIPTAENSQVFNINVQ